MFKNGKKKAVLVALLSCVLTAAVAFAAYTGFNYITGTVDVVGNPFKMVFAISPDEELGAGGTIPAVGHATVNGTAVSEDNMETFADIVSDLTVTEDNSGTQTLDGLTVRLSQTNDLIMYSFYIKNVGGSTAYLSSISIADTDMPQDATETDVTGLSYGVQVGTKSVTSTDGQGNSNVLKDSVAVAADQTIQVKLLIKAEEGTLFSAITDDDNYGAEIALGKVTIEWSAVPPTTNTQS